MPKMKTHKGLAKRIKISKRGKVLRRKAGSSHLMSSKSSKRRRKLRRAVAVSDQETKEIKVHLSHLR